MDYVKSRAHFVIFLFFFGIIMASEPRCLSRFDYDEKMLLKVLRFEDALQKFDKKITDIIDTLGDNERKRNSETKETVDEAKLKMKQVLEEIKQNTSKVLMNDSINLQTLVQEVKTLGTQMREELKRKEQYVVPLVMFKARHAFGTHTYTSHNKTVLFKDVMTNEGGSFEPNTGQFTASVSGVYMFIVQYCPDASKWAWLEIVSEGRGLMRSGHKGDTIGVCVSMQTFAKVLMGEKVWVRCTDALCQIYGNEGYRWNTFEGILLHL